jgi:hypothetical protein
MELANVSRRKRNWRIQKTIKIHMRHGAYLPVTGMIPEFLEQDPNVTYEKKIVIDASSAS